MLQKLALACLKRVRERSPVVNSPCSFLGHTENNKALHIRKNLVKQERKIRRCNMPAKNKGLLTE